MTTAGENIFESGSSDEYITYSIYTDSKGERYIEWGAYAYCADDSIYDDDRTWRIVSESVEVPLKEFVAMIGKVDPMDTRYETCRVGDDIDDVTEEEAKRWFSEAYNRTPKLDMEYITEYLPDGDYIGKYMNLRLEE